MEDFTKVHRQLIGTESEYGPHASTHAKVRNVALGFLIFMLNCFSIIFIDVRMLEK